MKNRDLNKPLSPAQLYVLEREAHAARSAELARLLRKAAGAVRSLFHA
jgi:hypothetical protein